MDQIEYISDTLLIEKVARLEIVLADDPMIKEAQLGELLGGVASSVKNEVMSRVDTSSPTSIAKSVVNLLAPGVFFKLNPILGILYTIGSEMFGINLFNILGKLTDVVKGFLGRGQTVPPEALNSAAESLLGTTASLAALHELEKTGNLTKAAVWPFSSTYSRSQPTGGSFAFPPRGATIWHRIFGFLAQRRPRTATSLLVGFVLWFLKTVLLSAGLLAGAGAISGVLGLGKPGEEKPKETQQPTQEERHYQISENPAPQRAEQPKLIGYPILGNVSDTVSFWVKQKYPQLRSRLAEITNDPTFIRVVRSLEAEHDPQAQLLFLPAGVTPDSVVDLFAPRYLDQKEQK